METEFIVEAFKPRVAEPAPEPTAFATMVQRVLSCEHPSFLFDSLFYRRAWNSLVLGLLRRDATPPPRNVLATALSSFYRTGSSEERDAFMWRWVEDFWLYTAHLCGTPPYRSLVHQLRALPEFARRWQELGDVRRTEDVPRGVPYYHRHPRIGTYRVFTLRIVLPPVYYVKEYVPVDEPARRYIDHLRAQGPVQIVLDPSHHWSMDGDEPALLPSQRLVLFSSQGATPSTSNLRRVEEPGEDAALPPAGRAPFASAREG